MSQVVAEKVLNWLYSVLLQVIYHCPGRDLHALMRWQEYTDVNRTYHDVAETLSAHASLSPKTELYSTMTMRPSHLERTHAHRISIRKWGLGSSSSAHRHAACHLSRRNLRLSGSDMGASRLPSRTADGIRDAIT